MPSGSNPTPAPDSRSRTRRSDSFRTQASHACRVLESVTDYAIISLDLAGRVLTWNPGAEAMFGYTFDEIRGLPAEVLFTQEDRAAGVAAKELETARKTGRASDDRWHLRKNGERFLANGVVTPIRDKKGTVRGYTKIARDVTGQRQAQDYLQKLGSLLELTHDAILAWNLDGTIRLWNLGAERLYGYSRSEAIGKVGHELLRTQVEEQCAGTGEFSIVDELKRTGQWSGELRQRTRDGREIIVESRQVLFQQSDGHRIVLETNHDITARRVIEEALHEQKHELSFFSSLAEATRELVDPREVMRMVTRHTGEFLRVSCCAYADVEADGDRFIVQHDYTDKDVPSTVGQRCLSLFGSQATAAMHEGRTLVIRNVDTELFPQGGADMLNAIGTKALVCCPLMKGGRLRAMMAVHQTTPRDWQASEVKLLEAVAERCWAYIETARAQSALLGEQQRLAGILNSAMDAIITVDTEQRIVFFNPAAEHAFRCPASEAIGLPLEHFIPERFRGNHGDQMRRFGERGSTSRHLGSLGQLSALRSDGTEFPIEASISHVEVGGEKFYTVILRDITDRRRAEQALRESEARMETVIAHLSEGVVIANQRGELFHWNRAALEIHGFSKLEEAQRRLSELRELFKVTTLEGDVIPFEQWPMPRVLQGEVLRDLTVRLVRLDSDLQRIVSYSGESVSSGEGEKVGFLSMTDITARVQAETALRVADRRKDEFLAMLAHELRNPLAAIRNTVQLCRAKEASDEECEWGLSVIERQGSQLSHIVDDLLDVSRITRGKVQLHKEQVDAAPILDHAVEVVRPLISERKHELITTYDRSGRALPLQADPARLEQIIVNLLTNAAKYTENGGRIWLEAQRQDINGKPEVLIKVRDTGLGISPEKLPEMFELFVQEDRGLSRSEGGLGLGLTIVKQLTEMHGGTISAQSEGLGKGSEFTLRMPAAPVVKPPAEVPHVNNEVRAGRKGSVLVVDDNMDAAQALARLLKLRGHYVEVSYDGESAIEKTLSSHPDFILLDIGLPGMSGYEVAQRLRNEDQCRGTVIVAVSGYGQEEDRRRAIEAGFDYHFVKPVDFVELKHFLDTARRPE